MCVYICIPHYLYIYVCVCVYIHTHAHYYGGKIYTKCINTIDILIILYEKNAIIIP